MAGRGSRWCPPDQYREFSRIRRRRNAIPGLRGAYADLHARCRQRIRPPRGRRPIYAGTDAGGFVAHGFDRRRSGRAEEHRDDAHRALGAACWQAREWLGRQALSDGAEADLLCFADDPRSGPRAVLSPTGLVILRGHLYGTLGPIMPDYAGRNPSPAVPGPGPTGRLCRTSSPRWTLSAALGNRDVVSWARLV